MTELKELLMDVRKELRAADKYANEATKHKHEYHELSEVYHRIANDKLVHADMLSKQAKVLADKHHMEALWDVEWYMIKHDMEEVKSLMC